MNNLEKITHIIQHIKNILHTRPKHVELVDFYHNVFEQYKEKVASLDDIITRPKILKEGLIETIEKVEERIYQSLDDYYAGRLSSAIAEMDFLFQDLDLLLPQKYNQYSINQDDLWYRGRIKKEGIKIYASREMFHIPNHMRENVSNQRFSFNGYPCLYLGKSIWTCWEELDEAHLDDICFAAVKITKGFRLFDLSIPTAESVHGKSTEELISILVTMPLKIACSVKTMNEGANFKSEYIIPQLLMIELIEHSRYDGYIFTSTKENATFGWNEKYLLNVVLPVSGEFDKNGLCISLKDKMQITNPICHQYEILKSTISNMISMSTEEIHFFLENGYEKSEDNIDLYPRTIFGQMEKILTDAEYFTL